MPPPPHALERQLLATLQCYRMLDPGDAVLVACSGGQDSLALLLALHRLAGQLGISLRAAHLHHSIRGAEADGDAEFVQGACEALGVPLDQGRADVPALAREARQSLEEAGRDARREFLDRTAAERGCSRIALGHTASDRAETLLMNILRGSGLGGLRSIPPVNGQRVRPLIDVSRAQTAAYCADRGLQPRQDSTNLEPDACLRNRVRLCLLPELAREYNPAVEAALLRLAGSVEADLDWIADHARGVYHDLLTHEGAGIALDLERLRALPRGLRRRVLQLAAEDLTGTPVSLEALHFEALDRLLAGATAHGAVSLPGGFAARLQPPALIFGGLATASEVAPWDACLPVPGELQLPAGGRLQAFVTSAPERRELLRTGAHEAFLDLREVGETLRVRNWLPGDRIAPLGMQGTRKLQDVFVDSKVPRARRHGHPVVVGARGDILWLPGLCLSRHGALRPGARRCARLTWLDAG